MPAISGFRFDHAQCPRAHPSAKVCTGNRAHFGGIHWYSSVPKYWYAWQSSASLPEGRLHAGFTFPRYAEGTALAGHHG